MLLRTWDIEATSWNQLKIASIYDGENLYYCHSPTEIINKMIELKGTFYAHFAGGYDNLFLLNVLNDYHVKIKNIKGRLIKISVYYTEKSHKKLFELRDSFPILPSGLESLTKSFGITLPIDEKKYASYKKRRDKIETFTREELEEYVAVDTIALYKILVESLKVFEKKDFKLTIAGEAMSTFRTMNPDEYKGMCLPSKLDTYLRRALTGGRVEVFKRQGFNLKHYDFKSMYPDVMRNKEYPAGVAIYTQKFNKDKLGIYTVEVESPKLQIPFLHAYSKEGKLLFPNGKWTATYTSVEIEKALKLGYKIKIIDGYYFTKRAKPFIKYVDHFYNMKAEAERNKQPARRHIAKLYLNSLFGKFGQRRKFQKIMRIEGSFFEMARKFSILDVIEELNSVVVEDESKSPFTTVHIACFVTAYARIKLYERIEEVIEKGGEVYYCDTDSIITNIDLTTGGNLGDLALENKDDPIEEAYFLFPKFYGYKTRFGKEVIRTKGLGKKFEFSDFQTSFKLQKYDLFVEVREGIIGVLEGHRRHQNYLEVLKRQRKVTGIFDKRLISENLVDTDPLEIS